MATAVQRPDGKVDIAYDLCNPTLADGDLVTFDYSMSGTFTDARKMSQAKFDGLHEGVFDLEHDTPAVAHSFVWDAARDLKDLGLENFVGTIPIRLASRIGLAVSPFLELNVTLDLSEADTQTFPPPVVFPGQTLTVQHAFFDGGVPIDPATVEITDVTDPSGAVPANIVGLLPIVGTMVSAGVYSFDIPLLAGAVEGTYRYTIDASDPGVSPFTWQTQIIRNFVVAGPNTNAESCDITTDGCVLYGTLVDAGGRPLANSPISVSYSTERESFTNISRRPVVVGTDSNGFFCVVVLRNVFLHIYSSEFPYSEKIKVPDAPSAEFRSIQTNQPAVLPRDQFGNPI